VARVVRVGQAKARAAARARAAKVKAARARAAMVKVRGAVRVRAVRARAARAAKAGVVKAMAVGAMAVGSRVEVARAAKAGVANEARADKVVREEKVRVAVRIRRRLFCRLCDSCASNESRGKHVSTLFFSHRGAILQPSGRWEIFKVSVHVLSVVDRSIGSSCRVVQARVVANTSSAHLPIGAMGTVQVSAAHTHCS